MVIVMPAKAGIQDINDADGKSRASFLLRPCRFLRRTPHQVLHLQSSFRRRHITFHAPIRPIEQGNKRCLVVTEDLERGASFWSGDVWTVGNTWLADHHISWLKDSLTNIQCPVSDNLEAVTIVRMSRQHPPRPHTQCNHSWWIVLLFA